MSLIRYPILAMMLVAMAYVVGCSDDDDPVVPGVPDDPTLETVVISPGSAVFAAIGEDIQFDVVAFDDTGAVMDTVFTWQSSRPDVVAIGPNGVAIATGIGTAEIYAMAGGVTDTADVSVDLTGDPVIEWIAGDSGDWSEGANWSGGTAPGADDIAVLTIAGDYTVTLTGDVTVKGLVLGNETGTQTLATQSFQLTLESGGLLGGAELSLEGEVRVLTDLAWSGGSMIGSGTVELESGAELNVIGNPLELVANLNNNGAITLRAGSTLRVNGMLDNNTGAVIELQGDAIVSVLSNGIFSSSGMIQKSEGEDEAAILASSAEFTSTGSMVVDAGSLWLSGGSLRGVMDIAGDAILRQTSDTAILSVNSRGDGALEIGGSVTFGSHENQTISIAHVILDSGSFTAITGEANLVIDHSFAWRRGTVSELGSLTSQVGSLTTFEPSGTKALSATTWHLAGEAVVDPGPFNLVLANGGGVSIESPGRWHQEGGGTVSAGPGGSDGFHVIGEFHKTGEGAFVVETAFDCAGTLNLVGGALTVQGAFNLFDSGVITGGGIAEPSLANAQLIVVEAESAVMSGTIRPDLDGQPARMGINGNVDLESTFRLELDVPVNGDIPAEDLVFLRGGQVLDGTLEINVMALPGEGAEYRVVRMVDGTGTFDVIFRDTNPFDDIIQDGNGVLLRR